MDNENSAKIASLRKLMEPFDKSQISKLPKGTKAQNECSFDEKRSCKVCGGWHHPKIKHLDYVGHAALTKRLLEVDPFWNWEPVTANEIGEPMLDDYGGMWIQLTICGVTRLGYGDAGGKKGADANKERIGDALRNGAMRFGVAADLWVKSPVEGTPQNDQPENITPYQKSGKPAQRKPGDGGEVQKDRMIVESWIRAIDGHIVSSTSAALKEGWEKQILPSLPRFPADQRNELEIAYKDTMKALLEKEGVK